MQFQDISSLPPFAIIAFGISLALIYFVTQKGFSNGKQTPVESQSSAATVAAVIVDSSALNRLTASAEAQTFELINQRKTLERCTVDLTDAVRNLTRGITELREEYIRKGRT